MRVCRNRRLRKIFAPKTEETHGISFMTCTTHKYQSEDTRKKNEMDEPGGKFERERGEVLNGI